jgi:hypothetical protein
MVSCANRFVDQKGVIPTAVELTEYLLNVVGQELPMTRDDEKGAYNFGGRRLTNRSFKERYTAYLSQG